MPYKLSGLSLNRVDLCPAGANQGATIELFKSKEGRVPQKAKKASGKKPTAKADSRSKSKQRGDEEEEDEEDDVEKNLDDDVDDEDDVEDEEEDDDVEKSDEDGDEDDEDGEEDEDDEEEVDKSKSKSKKAKAKKSVKAKKTKKPVVKANDEDEDLESDDDADEADLEVDEHVLKSMPVPVRKAYERNQRIAKRALEIAEEERDRRHTLEFVEKAKSDIPNIPGKTSEKGALLKALYSGKPIAKKIADQIVTMLKAGDVAIKNMLMSEVGKRRSQVVGDGSAYDQLIEKRDEIMKADKKLTKEQAMEKAIAANADLYNQYRVEKKRRQADVN